MDWNARILDISHFDLDDSSLPSMVEALFEHQARVWSQLREGLAALNEVETRRLDINRISVSLQHNPQRIVSTSARVDEKSIRERPCFLCSQNMPDDEKGLAFGEDLIAFCNPFPVLERHLVVLARKHIAQRIDGHIEHFLDLAASLGRDYCVLYNGARCGASAPDHLHFQAGLVERLPLFSETMRLAHGRGLSASDSYGVGIISFRSRHRDQALFALKTIMETLGREPHEDEPLVNILARHDGEDWEVAAIPRRKHRPAAYFHEGVDQVLISPAAIDLAGLVVVPRKDDFEKLDSATLRGIFNEVTFSAAALGVITAGARARGVLEVRS